MTQVGQSSFHPTANGFSRSKAIYTPYKDVYGQNIAESLPSLLDTGGYIQNNYNQNDNIMNYVSKASVRDNRLQPQGSSSPSSITSKTGVPKINYLHTSKTANHLGNI